MQNVSWKILIVSLLATTVAMADDETVLPQTGSFELTLTAPELFGADIPAEVDAILRGDGELSWHLYVPESYDPALPAGVLVYVSPTQSGAPPKSWTEPLAHSNLIWIGANNSGNRVAVDQRIFYAMLAPRIVAARYAVDPGRFYVSGFSGGGRTATRVMASNPALFRGGMYMGGADMWDTAKPPPRLDVIQQNHHVFLSGTKDFNGRLTRRVHADFINAGITNSELIVEPHRGHTLPSASALARAITFLDSRNAVSTEDK
jgi:hypothetical protein